MDDIIQNNDIMGKVSTETIPVDYKKYAEIIGVENFVKLSCLYGGIPIYIPKLKNLIIPARNAKIFKEFNGRNTRELALKYNLSLRYMYELTREKRNLRKK